MKTKALLVAALALAALVATTGALAGSSRKAAGTISGAGSTFVAPLVSQWQKDYPAKTGTQITYNPIGSGGGIASITARTVDFGASDAPLTPDQFAACKGCVQIPWALSSTAILYNLPDVPNNLKITGPIIAQIYLGQITNWNSPAIKALNPKVTLPNLKITPVYRSDNSGTSYNFTDYLSTVSPTWKSKIGKGVNANWPVGVGGRGSSGVSGVVKNTEGAIGYADVAYSLANKLKFMSVKNKAGKFVTPGMRAITAAASTVKSVPPNNELSIVDPPKANALAYPICTFTWVIAPKKTDKAADLRKFIFYALTQGQTFGPKLLFVPIPKVVLVASEKTLKQIQS
jgi:phosphate transport system substrate-binding protein